MNRDELTHAQSRLMTRRIGNVRTANSTYNTGTAYVQSSQRIHAWHTTDDAALVQSNAPIIRNDRLDVSDDDTEHDHARRRKISTSADDAWVFRMLEAIKDCAPIWNDAGIRKPEVMEKCWKRVHERVNEVLSEGDQKTIDSLKTRWATIRNSYARRKRLSAKGRLDPEKIKWKYEHAVTFLGERSSTDKSAINQSAHAFHNDSPEPWPNAATSSEICDETVPRKVPKQQRPTIVQMPQLVDVRQLQMTPRSFTHAESPKRSRYRNMADSIASILESMSDRRTRDDAMDELIDWIKKYQRHTTD